MLRKQRPFKTQSLRRLQANAPSRIPRTPNSEFKFFRVACLAGKCHVPATNARTKCAVTTKQSLPPSLSHKHSINQHDEQRPTNNEEGTQTPTRKQTRVPPALSHHSLTYSLTHPLNSHAPSVLTRTHALSQSVSHSTEPSFVDRRRRRLAQAINQT